MQVINIRAFKTTFIALLYSHVCLDLLLLFNALGVAVIIEFHELDRHKTLNTTSMTPHGTLTGRIQRETPGM